MSDGQRANPKTDFAVRLRGVTKRFGEHTAVDDLD